MMKQEKVRTHFLREKAYLRGVCRRLNALLPVKDEAGVGEVNDILHEAMDDSGFSLYYNREVFMAYESQESRSAMLRDKRIMFTLNDDWTEHPGIVVVFKDEKTRNKAKTPKTAYKELADVADAVPLKPSDLMVGDIVFYNPNVFVEDEYEPVKEWEIVEIENGEDIDLAEEGCFFPIPMASESAFVTLADIGFTFTDSGNGMFRYKTTIELKEDFTEIEDCVVIDTLCPGVSYAYHNDFSGGRQVTKRFDGAVECVHQLQHIFKELGIVVKK